MKPLLQKLRHSLDSKEQSDSGIVFKPIREKMYVFFFVSIFGFSYFASALISELLQKESAIGVNETITSELSLVYTTLFSDGGFALRLIFNILFLAYILIYFLIIRKMEKNGKFIDKEATLKNKLNGNLEETGKEVATP